MHQEEEKLKSMGDHDVALQEDEAEERALSSREILLDLVKPELPSLSQNWLAALRDHAILSLSSGNQLNQKQKLIMEL